MFREVSDTCAVRYREILHFTSLRCVQNDKAGEQKEEGFALRQRHSPIAVTGTTSNQQTIQPNLFFNSAALHYSLPHGRNLPVISNSHVPWSFRHMRIGICCDWIYKITFFSKINIWDSGLWFKQTTYGILEKLIFKYQMNVVLEQVCKYLSV